MKISLIIPMYNESSIAADAVRTFSEYMEHTYEDWELIFVDDGSLDTCTEPVKAKSAEDARVRLVSYKPNRGKGCAIRQGVMAAEGDFIMFTDCDDAYGTDALTRLVETLRVSGSDMVVGSRNLSEDGYAGYTWLRKVASKTYLKFIGLVAGFKLSDSQCGIKGFRGEAAKKIFRNCKVDRFAFDLEVIMIANKIGYEITEFPVKIVNHRESTVHLVRDSLRMIRDVRQMKKRIKTQDLI